MQKIIITIVTILVTQAVLVALFMSLVSYHNRPFGYCYYQTNNDINAQVFCKTLK